MPKIFNRTSLIQDWTIATGVKTIDLPVNPISHLILTIDGYNVTDEATLAEIAAFINKIEVTHRGNSICSVESEDHIAFLCYLLERHPLLTSNLATDNYNRALTLVVPFGRRLYDFDECLPATKKGELQLSLDLTIPATSFDNANLNVECVELFGATPSRHLKYVQKNITAPGGTVDKEIPLPIGNDIIALLLYSTTVPAESSHTYGINYAKILVNNNEYGYSKARAHCLVGEWGTKIQTLPRDIAAFGSHYPKNFMFMDFNMHHDNEFHLKTAGLSDCSVVISFGVDEACHVLPVELVEVGG